MALKLTKEVPSNADYWNTLGVVYYRSGNWQAAVEALQKASDLRTTPHAKDSFFLAMAYWQADKRDEAHKAYAQAIQWQKENLPYQLEVCRIQREAGELLKIANPGE